MAEYVYPIIRAWLDWLTQCIKQLAERTRKTGPPYSEAQTKAWLSWLARGMQQHGQTVFMLEQLQPTWLATPGERVFYTIATRVIVGLLYGLIFGAAAWFYLNSIFVIRGFLEMGFIFGLSVALLDIPPLLRGGQTARPQPATFEQYMISVGKVLVILLFAYFMSCNAYHAYRPPSQFTERTPGDYVIDWSFMCLFPIFTVIWGIRNAKRTPEFDIQSVETLTWSWKAALKGCAAGGFVLLFALEAMLLSAEYRRGFLLWLVGPIVLGLVLGSVAGLITGVRDLKTVPNQGMRLSMHCALDGGLVVGVISALTLGPFSLMERSRMIGVPSGWVLVSTGLINGLVLGLAAALIAGTWFGGLDVILHYSLRLLLYIQGCTPLNLVRFLDYAAKDLHFLQKVGGGYIFIHRMLLEHFATMQTEGKSNTEETPAPDAPTAVESWDRARKDRQFRAPRKRHSGP